MSEDLTNVLEAKLYEATDQFSTLSGIAGARSDEASVVQSAEDDGSAIGASEAGQSPSSVVVSGVTSSAPDRGTGQSLGENNAAEPVAGASAGGRAGGGQQRATDPAQQAALGEGEALTLDAPEGNGLLGQAANILNDEGGNDLAGEAPLPGDELPGDDPDVPSDPDAPDGPGDGPGPGGPGGDPEGPDGPGDDPGGPGGPGGGDAEEDIDLVLDTAVNLPLLDPIVADVDVILDPVETLLGEDIDIVVGAGLDLDTVTPIVDQVIGTLPGGLLGSGPDQSSDTDLTVDVLADLGLGSPIIGDADVILDPVENLLGTDIDVDVDAIVDTDALSGVADGVTGVLEAGAGSLIDSLVGLGGSLLGATPDQDGDTDLTVDGLVNLGLGGPPILADLDVNLDPVENLLGTDIDVGVDTLVDLAQAGGVLDGTLAGAGGGGVAGSLLDSLLEGSGLLGSGGLLGAAPNQDADTDLTVDAVADLGLGAPLVADADVVLDPVENLLGTDIDVDLDANLADVASGAGGLVSGLTDGGLLSGDGAYAGDGLLNGGGLLGAAPNQDADTDLTVDAVADLGLGAPLVADADVVLDPVENLLGTDIDVDLDANLADVASGAGGLVSGLTDGGLLSGDGAYAGDGLLNGGGLLGAAPNQDADTDLTVDAVADLGLGAPLVADADVVLDPVENLLGTDIDVDLDANLADVASGAGGLVSGLTDGGLLSGDGVYAGDGLLNGGGLLGAAPDQDADTDLTVDAVADLGLGAPLVADADVVLDPVENLLGTDIDVDLDANLADVASGAGGLVSGLTDGGLLSGDGAYAGDGLLNGGGLLGAAPDQDADTDLTVDAVADLGLGAPLVADADVVLDPVENLLGTDIDVDLDANLADVASGAGGLVSGLTDGGLLSGDGAYAGDGLLNGGGLLGAAPNQDADTDLTVDAVADLGLGAPLVADADVVLDPVENLLGTDIDVDVDANLADVDGLLAGSESLGSTGSLLDLSGADAGAGSDTDLTLDIGLVDTIVANADVNLDLIESVLGTDIDANIDLGLDLASFDSFLSGGDLSGGNLTLDQLMSVDVGSLSTGSLTGSLTAVSGSLFTATAATTSPTSSSPPSLFSGFGGGLFG